MKTPDEIKKGLENCTECGGCTICEYSAECNCEPDCLEPFLNGWPLMCDALMLIQQLEAQVPKWISVEERLPKSGRYLVITKKGDGMTKVNTATYNDMGWWTYANFGEITHWMPLPKPPKEV